MDQSDVDASEKLNLSECHPNTCSLPMNTSEDPLVEEENKHNCSSRFQIRLEFLMSFFTLKRVCSLPFIGLIITAVIIVVCAFNPPIRIVYRPTVLTSNCTATSVMSNSTLTNLMLNSTPTKLTSDATPFPTTPVTNQNEEDLDVSAEPHRPNQDPNTGVKIIGGGSIVRGEDIILLCVLTTELNLRGDFHWWHGVKEISPEDKSVTISDNMVSVFSFLKIRNATLADSGKYTCQLRLKDGVTKPPASVYITVV